MKKPMASEVPRTAVPSDAAAIPANCDGNRARFRRRPTEVEAMCFTDAPATLGHMLAFGEGFVRAAMTSRGGDTVLEVLTLHGTTFAHRGEWVVRGGPGDYWPVKPDVFERTYEPVRDPNAGRAPCSPADATAPSGPGLLKALEAHLSRSEAREREAREALRGMLSLYGAIVDAHGGGDLGIDHADGCPQDDTCDCPLYVLARDAESRARRVIEGER